MENSSLCIFLDSFTFFGTVFILSFIQYPLAKFGKMHRVKLIHNYPTSILFRILILKLLDREREDEALLSEWWNAC